MKNNKILFPKEVIENSYESIISDFSIATKTIYFLIITSFAFALLLSFYIYVDVGVSARGVIKPIDNHLLVTSPRNGILSFLKLKENDRIYKDDTLCVVYDNSLFADMPTIDKRISDMDNMLLDLKDLVNGRTPIIFASDIYRQEYQLYCNEISKIEIDINSSKLDYERSKILYDKGIISPSEYEHAEDSYNHNIKSKENIKNKYISNWASAKVRIESERHDLIALKSNRNAQATNAVVKSPIDGYLLHINNVDIDSYVHAGQQLFELSPNGKLIVEAFLSTKDIGLVREGMGVNIRVDAFDYTQWGITHGNVISVAPDVTTTTSGSFYKVRCSINRPYLELKNGFRGYIKNGMSVNVRMIVTQRSLFNLLYDKLDSWLNPTVQNSNE